MTPLLQSLARWQPCPNFQLYPSQLAPISQSGPVQESGGGSLTVSMMGRNGYGRAGGLQLTQVSLYMKRTGSHDVSQAYQQLCDCLLLNLAESALMDSPGDEA